MATYTISAYQEMFADEHIEADDPHEALLIFQTRCKNDEVAWKPSAEDMDYTVSEQNNEGDVVSEVSSENLDIKISI